MNPIFDAIHFDNFQRYTEGDIAFFNFFSKVFFRWRDAYFGNLKLQHV